ncbi:AlpA family phage regulatory protein [Comamonas thiooxydans]|uniref:AlpA family phage regulatory protein n=1 Tax=Comamonas TaxID=283 RepID=UPI001CCEF283|nr:AlpA family phage regulatory protein [Comamonas thiooxydans]MCO8250768.1 AlpA family phage regulatory protein [Comamonas thiooxydans]UBQ40781.1 AlpA family phage regulatory protein [Comamonas thiooxydans]
MSTDSTSRFTKNVIPIDEVLTRTGLSRSMLYKLLRKDKFPHPTPMSNRAIGWFETDVESWLQASKAIRQANLVLPVVYMAGKMGTDLDNENPGREFSCWRIFDVSRSKALGDLGIENSDTDVLIAPPEEMLFHGTRTRFMYSGPWKARNGSHGYMHGANSYSPSNPQSAAYRGALQGISRADVVVAYLEDLEAFGTLVEIGYARAGNKRVIVITAPALKKQRRDQDRDHGIWFAIRAADRHIELPDHPGSSQSDLWRSAHAHAASVISEWYPHSLTPLPSAAE